MKDLWQRVAVAFVGIPVALAAVWVGPPVLAVLLSLVGAVCWFELTAIFEEAQARPDHYLALAAVAFAPPVLWWQGVDGILLWVIFVLVGAMLWRLLTFGESSISGVGATVFGSLYIGLGFSSALAIRLFVGGRWFLLSLLILIWVSDTSAFAIGKALGKTRLAPKISPGKTWEGALGSLVVVVAVAVFLPGAGDFRGIFKVLFALVVWLAALVGDLFESSLKREAGLKDSGSLLPGHGGLLDRLDSLLLAAPAAYGFLLLIGLR